MNRVSEFVRTLFTHRAVISSLMVNLYDEQVKVVNLEQALRCRDHALESLATPFVEPESTVPLKPIRLQRMSYAEAARAFERQNSARFRDIDEARRRKEQAASK